MTRERIAESYSVQELEGKKMKLKAMLDNPQLSEEEQWEIEDLLNMINKRIRLMNDLLIEFTPAF